MMLIIYSGLFGLGRNKTKYLKSKRKTVKLFPIVFTGGGLFVVGLDTIASAIYRTVVCGTV